MTVRKFEGDIDGGTLGTFTVTPDGRLISMDQAGGMHAELKA
jgi:hypothetical protein